MIVLEWLTKHFHWRLTAEPIENGDISVPEEEIILVKKKLEQIESTLSTLEDEWNVINRQIPE